MSAQREFRFVFAEWHLLRSVLNEVTHGFSKSVGDFEGVIGLPKPELERFLHYLCTLSENTTVDLDNRWVLVFRNATREALRRIPEWEFETRTGHKPNDARDTLRKLERFISETISPP